MEESPPFRATVRVNYLAQERNVLGKGLEPRTLNPEWSALTMWPSRLRGRQLIGLAG